MMMDNYLDLKNKGYNECYPLRCRAISALCKPEVAQFKLDKDGKITEWYNKKANQPTEEKIEAKIKELELGLAKQSKKQEVINSFSNTLLQGYMCPTSGIEMDAKLDDIDKLQKGYDLEVKLSSSEMVVRDKNNVNHTIALADVDTMLVELGINYKNLLGRLRSLKDVVDKATTVEEVKGIVW
jgi:hypothetical protein